MSNVQSYNALIDRFHAFASGHFILKRFSHGQIEVSDLEKFGEYPFMHVVPSNVTYAKGMKTFSFQIVLADLPRDKEDKPEYQREVLSDLQRIAEDLVAEITNHRMLFGDLITVQNVSLEPFLEEFQHTLTGWTISLDLLVPYYWDACSIPAEWNDFFESGSGGTGSILTFIDSINRDENGNVSLVNDEETPAPNYYYGTNDEGVRGWYLLSDEVGLTCETIGDCQTIIDIEAAIDALEEEILLKADITSISAVGFSNDYNDLDNKPTIPDVSGFVPYTGATQDVDLGEFELKAGQIEFDQTPTGAAGVGVMRWNDSDGTVDLGLKGGNVTLQVGQESVLRVVNKTATNVNLLQANYQAVRVTGAQGQRLKVDLALATTDGLSAETIGLVTETINNNQEGFITTSGLVRGINTTGSLQGETWSDGDILYLSPTTAGMATKVKPTAPNHLIILGYVIHAHINQGSIFVKVDNGYELDELHNVKITTPANNNVLAYTSATDIWENKTVATALGYTPVPETRTLTINGTTQDLSADRTFTIATGLTVGTTPITSGTVGRVLFEGTGNVLQESANFFWDNTNSRLGIKRTPAVELDVSGDIRSSGYVFSQITQTNTIQTNGSNLSVKGTGGTNYITMFQATGNVLIQNGGTTTDAGYKLDVNGTARVQGNAQFGTGFYWDNTNARLGIGTATPASSLQVVGGDITIDNNKGYLAKVTSGSTLSLLKFDTSNNCLIGSNFQGGATNVYATTNILFYSYPSSVLTERMRIVGSTGNVLIGTTTDAGYKLDVNGTLRVSSFFYNTAYAASVQRVQFNNGLIAGNLGYIRSFLNGVIQLTDQSEGDFNRLCFGGGTASFPSIKRASNNLEIKNANDTFGAGLSIGASLDTSAILQADSTTKGFLPPRMTTTQKNAIASPAAGLVVYDTTLGKLCVRTASAWETITSV